MLSAAPTVLRPLLITLLTLAGLLAGAPPAWSAWTWPLDGEVLTAYRNGDDPYAAGQHRGIDIAGVVGAPVVAAAGGEVLFAGTAGSSGLTVSVRTEEGLDTSYLHLSALGVAKGDRVAAGARLGAVGTSGRRTTSEPHLHFGVRESGSRHAYRDPLSLLGPRPKPPARTPEPAPSPAPVPVVPAPAPRPVRAPGQVPAGRRAPRRVPAGRRVPRWVPAGRRATRRIPAGRRVPAARPDRTSRPAPVGIPRPDALPARSRPPVRHRAAGRAGSPDHAGQPEGRFAPEAGTGPSPLHAEGTTTGNAAPSPSARTGGSTPAWSGPRGEVDGGPDLGWALACLGLLLAAGVLGLTDDGRRASRRGGLRIARLARPLLGRTRT